MTLTPDRTPENSDERGSRPGSRDAGTGSDSAAGEGPAAEASSADASSTAPSLFDQLKDASLDLTGHPLAEKFESLAAVSTGDSDESNERREPDPEEPTECNPDDRDAAVDDDCGAADHFEAENGNDSSQPAEKRTDADATTGSTSVGAGTEADVGTEADAGTEVGDGITCTGPHPLLSNEEWTDLSRFAPEITESLNALGGLRDGLRTFDRRLGAEDAIKLIDGLEALSRVNEALSTLALAVCERDGTPTDYGAKTTKALIQDRLNITSREANRRTDMAKNLGGRVTITGQAQPPLYPKVADAFNEGRLSADQATVIKDCLKKLPTWARQEDRDYAESTLVAKAPSVRVYDLRAIFTRILAHIDPDGKPPTDPTDRSMYKINMHARESGDWEIAGLLDPVTGGQLNGLLTARTKITKTDDDSTELSGCEGSDNVGAAAASESGVLEDGSLVDMSGQKLTAQEWIYERFATLIGRIDMTRTGQGAQYALVVTAKAEDLANGTGAGATGSENPIPISELVRDGLNGAVFFDLISEKAKTMQVVTENRYANSKQVAILTARDQGCTFPGCDAPPG